jgi:hypothetical protein
VRVGLEMPSWRRMAHRTMQMDTDTPTTLAILENTVTRRRQEDRPSWARTTKTTVGCFPSACHTFTATLTTCLTSTTNRSHRDRHSIKSPTMPPRRCRHSSSTLSYNIGLRLPGICRCTLMGKHIPRCRIKTARIPFIFRRRHLCPDLTPHQSSLPNRFRIQQLLLSIILLWDRRSPRKCTNISTIVTPPRS